MKHMININQGKTQGQERPRATPICVQLGTEFTDGEGRRWRVESITEHFIIATRAEVVGEPTRPTDVEKFDL